MPNTRQRVKLSIVSGILFAGIIAAMLIFSQERIQQAPLESTPPSIKQTTDVSEGTFSYEGREGIDALTLLEESAEIETAPGGFVTAINGRVAQESKREFWSFYVNGEQAQVGAAEYETSSTDTIEWKIETY